MLLRRDGRTLTGSHGREDAACASGDNIVDHLAHLFEIDGIAKVFVIVVLKGCEQRGENTSKLRSVSNLHSDYNIVLDEWK
jgi:hypothetical protein